MTKRSNLRLVRALARPLWFYVFLSIPVASIVAAGLETYYSSLAWRSLELILNADYVHIVLKSNDYLPYLLAFTLILYIPFLIPVLLFGLGEIRRPRLKSFLNLLFTTVGIGFFFSAYLFFVQGLSTPLLSVFIGSVGFSAFLYAIYILIDKWSAGEIASIHRTAIVLISSVLITVTFLFALAQNIPSGLHSHVIIGLWKDLALISVIYLLLTSYGTWIVTRYSLSAAASKLEKVDHRIPFVLSIVFVAIALFNLDAEFAWYSRGFAAHVEFIYGTYLHQQTINALWGFNAQHVLFRSVFCLFIGVVFTTIVASLVKVGAHYALSRAQGEGT